MSRANRAISFLKLLPEPLLAEVIDFAEFLPLKKNPKQTTPQRSFNNYVGKLAGSPHFNEDPVKLQREWRDEQP